MRDKAGAWSLLPLGVFILVYLIGSIALGDFYKIPIHVAFLISSFFAVVMTRHLSMANRIKAFTKGMGDPNIMLMCLIFILSAAFSQLCKDLGSISIIVNLSLGLFPSSLLVAGLFIIACMVSLAVGTSVGTINVLAPIAIGLASKTDLPLALILASVVSGSMFGDNLSMISDTTIVASRTQKCNLGDKFKTNFIIVLPPAIITVIVYFFISASYGYSFLGPEVNFSYDVISFLKASPYLLVLILALIGLNVAIVLAIGCILAVSIGLLTADFSILSALDSISKGFENMALLAVVCMIIGGVMQLVKINGGIKFLINLISTKIRTQKGAQIGIAVLIIIIDMCTANNTIAILLAGDVTHRIASTYRILPAQAASLLDTFSCFAQGLIPYGAQILTAVALTGFTISPLDLMQYQFYTLLVGIFAFAFIFIPLPSRSQL